MADVSLVKGETTVIIPTLNAGSSFVELLEKLQSQSVLPSKIIIADSESRDGTVEGAKSRGCEVLSVQREEFDHGTTRNYAVSKVSSEFVVFLTQDAVPADEFMIEKLIEPMQIDSKIAICYGRQLPGGDAGPLERFAREYNYPPESVLKTPDSIESMGLKTFFCSNVCSAIRRSIFNKLGGFKDKVIVNEDMLFAAKAITQGYSVYYNAEAKVYHSHPFSLIKTTGRYFNIGRFFAENKLILKQAELKSYSSDMLKTGVKKFWKQHSPHHIAALLLEFTIKAIAFKLGFYYQLLFHCKQRNGT